MPVQICELYVILSSWSSKTVELNLIYKYLKNLKIFLWKKDAFDCAGIRAQVFRLLQTHLINLKLIYKSHFHKNWWKRKIKRIIQILKWSESIRILKLRKLPNLVKRILMTVVLVIWEFELIRSIWNSEL